MSLIVTTGVVREAVACSVGIPDNCETATYKPISNRDLIELVRKICTDRDLTLIKGKFGISNKGQRMFGMWEVRGKTMNNGMQKFMLGIANSYDKEIAAKICFGSKVTVCENLDFVAEDADGICGVGGHKHTTKMGRLLPTRIGEQLDKLEDFYLSMEHFYNSLRGIELSDEDVALHIFRAHAFTDTAQKKIITPLQCNDVYAYWKFSEKNPYGSDGASEHQMPWHSDFEQRNAYALYNSFTEIQKKHQSKNLPNAHERGITLNNYFRENFPSSVWRKDGDNSRMEQMTPSIAWREHSQN